MLHLCIFLHITKRTTGSPKMKGVLVIKADGQENFISTAKRPSLEQMQEWVGGYIQAVPTSYEGKKRTMVVNEEGAINGLPLNPIATKIYRSTSAFHHKELIFGTAVILIGFRL